MNTHFPPEGRVEMLYNNADAPEPIDDLVGREAIARTVSHMMKGP
jgi:hypothetical protein